MVAASIPGDPEAMHTRRTTNTTNPRASKLRTGARWVRQYLPSLALAGAGLALIVTALSVGIGWVLLIVGAADALVVVCEGRRDRDSAPGPAARRNFARR
jgi:hypothetical protein